MAITNGYCSLSELKARLGITDTNDDTVLEAVIEAASRAIDGETGRVFYATTETRYFTAEDGELLFVDDLLSVTSLKTDLDGDRVYETTWSATDYDLEPYNRTPKTRIQMAPYGTRYFPSVRRGVEITGSWGYSATAPDAINEACLLMAARLFKRKGAPFGVLMNPDLGTARIPQIDPDVKLLIRPFVRLELGGV